jgi:hypothetical protein
MRCEGPYPKKGDLKNAEINLEHDAETNRKSGIAIKEELEWQQMTHGLE